MVDVGDRERLSNIGEMVRVYGVRVSIWMVGMSATFEEGGELKEIFVLGISINTSEVFGKIEGWVGFLWSTKRESRVVGEFWGLWSLEVVRGRWSLEVASFCEDRQWNED